MVAKYLNATNWIINHLVHMPRLHQLLADRFLGLDNRISATRQILQERDVYIKSFNKVVNSIPTILKFSNPSLEWCPFFLSL